MKLDASLIKVMTGVRMIVCPRGYGAFAEFGIKKLDGMLMMVVTGVHVFLCINLTKIVIRICWVNVYDWSVIFCYRVEEDFFIQTERFDTVKRHNIFSLVK